MLVYKKEPKDVVEFQLDFFKHIGVFAPKGIKQLSATEYVYEHVEGTHPTTSDAPMICTWMNQQIWQSSAARKANDTIIDPDNYLCYVESKLEFAKRMLGAQQQLAEPLFKMARDILRQSKLTHAIRVHGDLTADNILMTNAMVLIDPGRPIINCVELDLGKLSMSFNGGFRQKEREQSWILRSLPVIAFEITHWIRACAHPEKQRHDFSSQLITRFRELSNAGF